MNYSFLSFLLAWLFPTKEYRAQFRTLCKQSNDIRLINRRKKKYIKLKDKLSKKLKKEPLKVLFLVNEIAKWKAQSLYDLMDKSKEFEPIIALTLDKLQAKMSFEDKSKVFDNNKFFFDKKNMRTIIAFDIKKNQSIDLQIFNPDIVFLQQPWSLYDNQMTKQVSKYSLTCYFPYYLQNYGAEHEYNQSFHKFLHKYYILNEKWADLYNKKLKYKIGSILPLGHPILDAYKDKEIKQENNCVIYAPHYSISNNIYENPVNFSTFKQTGVPILEFAKKHPEIQWIFKPHPKLKNYIIQIGLMTENEINNYYNEWESIGIACYDCDYKKLFDKSKLMITDCCSFLTEYFATGKPLIHLISPKRKIIPMPPMSEMFDCFYKANDLKEMFMLFDKLIINNDDPMKEKRVKVLKKLNLLGNNAAQNIVDDLIKTIKGENND